MSGPLTPRGPQPAALPGSPPAPGPLLSGSSQHTSFRISEKNYHLINSEHSACRAITSSQKKVGFFFFKGIINHIFIFLMLWSETTAAFLLRTRPQGQERCAPGSSGGWRLPVTRPQRMPDLGWVRAQSQGRLGPGQPGWQEGWPAHEVSSVSLAEPALRPGPAARECSVQGGWPCAHPSSGLSLPGPRGVPHRFHASARPQPQPMGHGPHPRLSLRAQPSDRNFDVLPRTHRLRAESSGQV